MLARSTSCQMRWIMQKDAAPCSKSTTRTFADSHLGADSLTRDFLLLQTAAKPIKCNATRARPQSIGPDLSLASHRCRFRSAPELARLEEKCFRKIRHGCNLTRRNDG